MVSAVDRNGYRYLRALESKRLTNEEITKELSEKIEENSTLCTDGHHSFRTYSTEHLDHEKQNQSSE